MLWWILLVGYLSFWLMSMSIFFAVLDLGGVEVVCGCFGEMFLRILLDTVVASSRSLDVFSGRRRRAAAMSWQSYVDDHLMYEISPGHSLSHSAIIGLDGNVWAQSHSFPEVRTLF